MENKTQLITDLIVGLFLAKGRGTPNMDLVEVWYNFLCDYNESDLKYAFNKEMKSRHEFITVGRIIDIIDPEPDLTLEAGDKWVQVMQAVNNGADSIKALPEDLYNFVYDTFGNFLEMKRADDFKLRNLERRFIAAYREKKQNADKDKGIREIEGKINPEIVKLIDG